MKRQPTPPSQRWDNALSETQLQPVRHPAPDLFLCDITDAVLKDDMASMSHPIFTLSKKPDRSSRRYDSPDGSWLEVHPGVHGLATIYDKDILIYAISQIIAAKNRGQPYGPDVIFNAKEFLIFANRHTGGRDYRLLEEALSRLNGTRLHTNIKTGDEEEWRAFGLIDGALVRRKTRDGRVIEWGISLSKWLMRAIESNEVLTIHKDYFRLRRPLERRIYEIARKHCGRKTKWSIKLDNLQNKCGSSSPRRHFRAHVMRIAEFDHLPDYYIDFIEDEDLVVFLAKRDFLESQTPELVDTKIRPLKPEIFDKFRRQFPGYDPYYVEQEWRRWASDKDAPDNPEGAFLAFAKKHLSKALPLGDLG